MLGSNIHEIDGFLTDHILQTQFAQRFDGQITHSFATRDDSFSILVTSGIIESITCYKQFLFNGNVIGTAVMDFTGHLVNTFGKETAEPNENNYVEYDDGDIQHDVDFNHLNMFVTANEKDVILSVSVQSDWVIAFVMPTPEIVVVGQSTHS